MDIDGKLYCPHCMRVIESEGPCPHCGHGPDEPRPPMALETGTLLNRRYQLGSVIGQGGFGITYAAWDETLGMPVAIKEYFPTAEAARDIDESDDLIPLTGHEAVYLDGLNRFRRESNLLASLQGIPCVVKVLDFFSENETAYLVMEFVHGVPVDQWVRKEKIKPRDLIAKLRPVLDALVRTHSQGVIHRDITPDNLLVTEDGSFRLIDFGSAVEVERSSGTIVLTRKYAPVEQYGREYGALGPWTDVYGLAAVIYELVSGQEPVESPLRAHHDGMKPLTRMKTGLKRSESSAITNALVVAPEKRTQSMAEFRARLYNLPLPEEVRKRKRFIRRMSIAATILLILSALTVANFTTGLPLGNGLLYSFTADGVYIVRELNQQEERDLPASVLSVPVKGVKADAFRGDETLTRVTIPGNVQKIEDTAFYGCTNLKEATLAEGVEEIGLSAFGGCNQMLTLTIPDTVTAIGEGAIPADAPELTVWGSRGNAAEVYSNEQNLRFADASELTWTIENGQATLTSVQSDALRLTLPNYVDGVPVIGIADGVHLIAQVEIWLPEYLEKIPTSLCYWNEQLKIVNVGPYVVEIGDNAFRATNIDSYTFSSALQKIGNGSFAGTKISVLDLPDRLSEIGRDAFYACMQLQSVQIPDSVEYIGACAFEGCLELREVQLPEGLTELEDEVFNGCAFQTILLPSSIRRIGKSAFGYSNLEWIQLPAGIEEIDNNAFQWCECLRYVGIPNSCTDIAEDAFTYCAGDMVISAESESVAYQYALDYAIHVDDPLLWTNPGWWRGNTAAYDNYGCDSAIIHVPLYNAFDNCLITSVTASNNEQVVEIWLPPWQTEIETCAFMFCSNLQRIKTTGKIKIVGQSAFTDCFALTEFPFECVERIMPAAFMGCSSLETPKFSDTLLEIGYNAFVGCKQIKEAIFPPNVMRLAEDCFAGSGICIASIPGNLRKVHESYVFDNCNDLHLLIVEEGVVSVGHALAWYAWYGDALTPESDGNVCAIFLPSTLETLDDDWLGDWNAVTTIWVFNPEMEISDRAFRPEQLTDLVIYGIEGSTAEAFALANGVEYRSLSAGTPMPSTETLVSIYREIYEFD